MLGKILKHFIAPRAELAAEKLNAKLRSQTAIRVLGQNMEPTIRKDTVIMYRALSPEVRLERGTVVVVAMPDFGGHAVPFRLIATEGDRVRLQGGKLFLNEQHVTEPYVQPDLASSEYSTEMTELIVPAGAVFLLGDYRDASKDSRVLGPIPLDAVLGSILPSSGEA
jgi:signal peptidase I